MHPQRSYQQYFEIPSAQRYFEPTSDCPATYHFGASLLNRAQQGLVEHFVCHDGEGGVWQLQAELRGSGLRN